MCCDTRTKILQAELNGPVSWPARPPDKTPLDFNLRGHIRSLIYETPVECEMDFVGRMAGGRYRAGKESPRVL